jgi:hypothetical protein
MGSCLIMCGTKIEENIIEKKKWLEPGVNWNLIAPSDPSL